MSEANTLTRGEALDLIDRAAMALALPALATEWIGHPQEGCTPEEIEALLREYVAEAALTDDVRSNGPKDSDDTGIPS